MLLNHQYKSETRDPRSLRVHKLRRHFPEIDKEQPDWKALTQSVGASGVLQPLLITAEGHIADGGWRWESAKDWQLREVPVMIIPEELVGVVIAETLVCRKQMTRGATVYLLVPIMQEIVQSGEFRRLANLKSGRNTNEIELKPQHFSMTSNLSGGAVSAREAVKVLSARWGICITRETFRKAQLVWAWLNEPECLALKRLHTELDLAVPGLEALRSLQESLKLDFEHQLLTGEKNLWNVESGIKGSLTGGAHEPPQKQLELFGDALDSLAVRSERFASPDKAAPEVRRWILGLEKVHEDEPEKLAAKLQQVAETCEVTRRVIHEHLKKVKV